MIELDNYENPKEGKTYISPSLDSFAKPEIKIRIASKVINSPESFAFAMIKDEIIIRQAEGAKTHIVAKFFEDSRRIFALNIQGYTIATDKPHNASFSLRGNEIDKFIEFVQNIQLASLEGRRSINVSDEELTKLRISDHQAKILLSENEDVFAEILKSSVTKEDIVAVGYRKSKLKIFERLLTDADYFKALKERANCGNEAIWQRFFEKNKWVFGYGLGYIFLSSLDDKKLEQVVQGATVEHHGKRVDALMKTRGVLSNLCFIELKTHQTPLLENVSYRSGCWAPSKELAGAVAQVQGTVASAVKSLSSKIQLTDGQGNPNGEEVFNYQPKSFLVIGNLSEFVGDHGTNIDKFRSFELYRRNTMNPEIVTFDELYERAKCIVQHNEK